jgi:NAD(P)-dependent dehydrogenase (short-subunit alcohol dehydrogenase family)
MNTTKKVWFITGISRGLGKALAESALLRGNTVIGTSRNGKVDIQPSNGKLHVLPLDVTNREQVFAAVEKAYGLCWRLDVVVNNAGYGLLGAMEGTSSKEFNHVMDVNFFGTVNVMQAALPYLRAQHSGHIVNLSSIAGLAPSGGYAFYAAAKFAVEGISTAVSHEVRDLGINVTIVEPGAVRTDFLSDNSIRHTTQDIEDYVESAGQVRSNLEKMNGQQLGDPMKAAQAILQAVDSDSPPLHLLLGSDAYKRAKTQVEAFSQEMETWKDVTMSTDYAALVAR